MLVAQYTFARTYGEPGWDCGRSVSHTPDGGFILTGWEESGNPGSHDILVMMVSPEGEPLWAKSFGGPGDDRGFAVSPTADNGFVVAGWTSSFGAGSRDFIVLKLSSDGSLAWARTFGGPGDDRPYSLTVTGDGEILIAGLTGSFGSGGDFLIIKIEQNGNPIWAYSFGGTGYDHPHSVALTADGGCVVAGGTNSFGAGGNDVLVLRILPDGSVGWARTFGGPVYDWCNALEVADDGTILLAGFSYSFGSGADDFFVLALSSDGSLVWSVAIGGADHDEAWSITRTEDGGLLAAGISFSFGSGGMDALLVKLDQLGSLSWARTFGGRSDDQLYSVKQVPGSGHILTGYTKSYGLSDNDLFLLRIDGAGEHQNCLLPCSPNASSLQPVVGYPDIEGTLASISTQEPNLTERNLNLSVTDVCLDVRVGENGASQPGAVECRFCLPGQAVFHASVQVPIRIYSADARLAYSGNLTKGENRISLDRGVYLWIAGPYRGRVAVW